MYDPDHKKAKAVEAFLAQKKATINISELVSGIRSGNRSSLARSITLLESTDAGMRQKADELLAKCMPYSGESIRIGITGVPGVGKSTFIESFGKGIISKGYKLAVLAIDPSSKKNKGSILGDKTRMEELSVNRNAFVRPSPSAGSLGGVANATRESVLLCEAAGYNVILIETVGVGQSEYMVHNMVDFFLLLMLPGAGDEIQGIKRGIMEMADMVVINKADTNEERAAAAATNYRNALRLFPHREDKWVPEVLACSALQNTGIEAIWTMIEDYRKNLSKSGVLKLKRENQLKNWFFESLNSTLQKALYAKPGIDKMVEEKLEAVRNKHLTPYAAANELVTYYLAKT